MQQSVLYQLQASVQQLHEQLQLAHDVTEHLQQQLRVAADSVKQLQEQLSQAEGRAENAQDTQTALAADLSSAHSAVAQVHTVRDLLLILCHFIRAYLSYT